MPKENFTQLLRHNGEWIKKFDQCHFIGKATFKKDGICAELCFKWLAEQGTSQPVPFFTDLKGEGREEVFALAYYSVGRPKNVINYLKMKGMRLEGMVINRKGKIDMDGKYLICLDPENKKTAGHALSAFVDRTNKNFRLFDPNYGEFKFGSTVKLAAFMADFTKTCYYDLTLTNIYYFPAMRTFPDARTEVHPGLKPRGLQ